MPAIEADFGGETRAFNLRIGELRKVEAKCNAGPGEIAQALAQCVAVVTSMPSASAMQWALTGMGAWRVDWIREPIFQGLLGGGMNPNDAGVAVRTWIDERGFIGLVENAGLALRLILSGISMPADEADPDAGPGEAAGAPASHASRSARSTKAAAPSASASATSTKRSSGSSSARSPASTGPTAGKKRSSRRATKSTTG